MTNTPTTNREGPGQALHYTYMCTCIHNYTHAYVYAYMHTCILHVYVSTDVIVCVCVCVCCVCVCVRVCVCVCVCVCMYGYTCMQTCIDHRLARPHTNMLRVKYETHTDGETWSVTWSAAACATWSICRLSSSWRLEREPAGGCCNADILSCPTCNGLDPCIYHMYTYALS